jgi:uncharacterized membrane protein YgcG
MASPPSAAELLDPTCLDPRDIEGAREENVKAFLEAVLAAEVARLADLGQRVLTLKILNAGVVVARPEAVAPLGGKKSKKGKKGKAAAPSRVILNRVELGTTFDFNRITQILVSPSAACDPKPG